MSIGKFLGGIFLILLFVVVLAVTVGFYPKNFMLEWDEEVQLHDGQKLMVHVKTTYERLHKELGPYTSAIHRDVEISFDSGANGPVRQLIKGGKPLFLDKKDGIWYFVFSQAHYRNSQLTPGQDFGPDQNGYGQRVATLQGKEFKVISLCDLPNDFQKPNFVIRYGGASELAKFDGKILTLKDKTQLLEKYPPRSGDILIERPAGAYACSLIKK